MRIAVVGGGISGLVAARALSRDHEVHLFEAADRLGGHTHTVDVQVAGRTHRVDTGFIVFNERNYPLFSALLDELGVASRPTSMSFSVRSERSGVEYCGSSLDGLFTQRRNALRPAFWGMLADILRFNRLAPATLEADAPDESVADWVARHRFSRAFVEDHLQPLGAALWSCPTGTFMTFPMRFLTSFLSHHGMLGLRGRPTWRTVVGGSDAYLEPLVAPFERRIHLNAPVARVRRGPSGVTLAVADGEEARFDHVVLACHSDQALRMVEDARPIERAVLSAIRYQPNEVVLHTDTRVLPRSRRAWASWNYRVTEDAQTAATVTYDMNILQGISAPVEFLVSLNQTERIDPARILRRLRYAHPIFDLDAEVARRKRSALLDVDGVSYCGAYWGHGFHEDGVRSALEVARALEGAPVA